MTGAAPLQAAMAELAGRLDTEVTAWLVTTDATGMPHPTLVWFIREGSELVVYSRADARRVRHLEQGRSRIAVHFAGTGGASPVLHGEARIDRTAPSPDGNAAYVRKYGDRIANGLRLSLAGFAERYPVPIRIRITRVRAT